MPDADAALVTVPKAPMPAAAVTLRLTRQWCGATLATADAMRAQTVIAHRLAELPALTAARQALDDAIMALAEAETALDEAIARLGESR